MKTNLPISEYFRLLSATYLAKLISARAGETKLGERVCTISDLSELTSCAARFVLIGIPEDIGVRANFGVGGANSVWEPALKAILNVQSTDLLNGDELLVLGRFDFSALDGGAGAVDELRKHTEVIDSAVAPLIEMVVRAGKTPIVIGGGHNNAFPLLKGSSVALAQKLHCMNLDAHSDYRIAEGRHSGNGFRFARNMGYLDRYAVVGLHENYNSRDVVAELFDDPSIHCSFYEDIMLRELYSFREAVFAAIQHTEGAPCGIEIDLDSIAGVLASAATPCGITTLQARQYITWCASHSSYAYLHIAEGAVTLSDGRTDPYTGKLIAYLVTDFLKAAHQLPKHHA